MRVISKKSKALALAAALAGAASGSMALAQSDQGLAGSVTDETAPPAGETTKGPEIEGIISARSGARMQVTAKDGTKSVITITDATKITSSQGLFGLDKDRLAATSLLNGLPVNVKTLQSGAGLMADQITLKGKDLKVATMIRNGTEQGFAEQTAATDALRSRMGDIDQYNIKSTTNVNFDTGKWAISEEDKAELCNTARTAEATDNALLLVVGYTDSVGDDDYNQELSEKRASKVVNYLQQACKWKPYRMLTPTGMAKADPLADNSTEEGKAQNRRVAVNVLVSKAVDGL
jgi:OmpA-OmpF porin, OOP family